MKFLARAAVPAVAVALLAGCSTPSGDTAFEVNGNRTSVSSVDDAAVGCEAVGQGQINASAIKGQVARMLLAGQLARTVAERNNFTIDGNARAAAITELQGNELMKNDECARAVTSFGDFSVVQKRLGAEQLRTEIGKLAVQVNPRYGQWDASKMSFTGGSGSLSRESLGNGQVFGG